MRRVLFGKRIMASPEHKWLLCLTCGKATYKVHCRHSNSLRKGALLGKIKTYQRIIKPSKRYKTTYHGKECRQKEIYYSYNLLSCIAKHHRLSVRKAPFTFKGMKIVC